MGRPLNARNFLDAGILVRFNDGGGTNVDGVIIKQTGSKRFICADDDAGTGSEECVLVSKLLPAAGECSIVLDATAELFVTKISGRKLTASNGETYTWSLGGVESDSTGDHFDLTDE